MPQRALLVGGCPATFHKLERAEPSVRACLEALGLAVAVTGMYHPDGKEPFVGDYAVLTDDGLKDVDVLVLYTTGRDRFGADSDAIVRFVESGRALVGIHNAADTFTDSEAYVRLIGGRFRHHPDQLDIAMEITDAEHPIMVGIEPFTVKDELYLFADYDPANVHLLAQTRSYDDNGPVPLSWTREQGAGRVFYVSLGHNQTTLEDPAWQQLFKNGVEWALRRR